MFVVMKNHNLIIMAGGSGSRSCSENKEFLDILGKGRTLLQQTFDRFKDSVEIEKMWVVTDPYSESKVREQLPNLKSDQILIEPCKRNTAISIAYAAIKIREKNPYANIVITPSDHIVINTREFTKVINCCLNYADENSEMVSIGVYPSRSETSYGYIHSNSQDPSTLKQVINFIEKPSLYKAKEYIQTGNYYWNTGIYFSTVKTLERVYHKHLPVLASHIDKMAASLNSNEEHEQIRAIFPKCQSISIDRGILEKLKDLKVYEADMGWTDAYSNKQDLEDILESL